MKDKILELTIKELISDEEFYNRKQKLNEEITNLKNQIQKLKEEKENISSIEENMKIIKRTLEKDINIGENIEDLIKLLVDKIYVSKIDNNRKHIKLKIYFKLGEPISLEGNLNKKEYIIEGNNYQSSNNNNNGCAIIENDSQFRNHEVHNSTRHK